MSEIGAKLLKGDPIKDLSAFVSGLTYDDVPSEAIAASERAFLDTVGVTLAGVTEGAGSRSLAAFRSLENGGGTANVIGRDVRLPLLQAVFVNGTAGHVHDYDDYTQAIIAHPSVVLVAPILAVGEITDTDGKAALTAYIAGFETQCYVGQPIMPEHYERGWHSTSTLGTLGATASVAWLFDLTEEEIEVALNAACSMLGGLRRNIGTMVKPVHIGQAGRSGITAAILAAQGITAAENNVCGKRGFFELYAGEGADNDTDATRLGETWAILEEGIYTKPYPCCSDAHTSIDALRGIIQEHSITGDAVDEIGVDVSQRVADTLVYDEPNTGFEAMFSLPHVLASLIIDGTVDIETFDDENVLRTGVHKLRDRIHVNVDESLDYMDLTSRVTVTTSAGTLENTARLPRGHPDRPMSKYDLQSKFRECASYSLDDAEITTVLGQLTDMRHVREITDLMDGL